MSCRFPNLINWIDDMTMDGLHKLHNEVDDGSSFSEFVQNEYDAHKEQWHDEMKQVRKINILMDENCDDTILESAKQIFPYVMNHIMEESLIWKIMYEQQLEPDYQKSVKVVETFWHKIIPAIEKTINELK